ncbi:MAG TPA: carbohydrate-binding module family 20 domain-containing protein, partial [Vicinamibacterales bacterium]|nr:carbohydrate-binding module family 20 domain-containing protein [Vicinamibacterales bacterium]
TFARILTLEGFDVRTATSAESGLREMVRLARERGSRPVLLDNELWSESPYRSVLQAISRDERVPLVDSLRIIQDERTRIERDLEARFRLERARAAVGTDAASTGQTTTVIFRVFEGAYPVPRQLSIVGNQPPLGNLAPNTVSMRDDGKEGDEHASDRVWSYRATFPSGTRLRYVYTNSGQAGQWEGLDVPHVRELQVPPSPDGQPVYLSVESFGRIYMQADNWHTDAVGYDLIARAVVDTLKSR